MSRRDPYRSIVIFNRGRDPDRLAMKFEKMAKSPFAFCRGSCHLFYSDLALSKLSTATPNVWICGDLHLENFGTYYGDNRRTYFDINDFDEAILAPVWWDLARFLTSLIVAGEQLELRNRQIARLWEKFLKTYANTLSSGTPRSIEFASSEGPIRDLLAGAQSRTRTKLLSKRTEFRKGKLRLKLKEALTLKVNRADRESIEIAFKNLSSRYSNPAFFTVLDVARRVSGLASLGLERYVVLVRGEQKKQGFLVDLKHQPGSSLEMVVPVHQPSWPTEADRVAKLTQQMQAVSPALLNVVTVNDRSFTVRELMPQEDRLEMDRCNEPFERLQQLVKNMAQLTAWTHLRGSSHQGADEIEALSAFGNASGWRWPLLEYAFHYADNVLSDWKEFRAVDVGELVASGAQ